MVKIKEKKRWTIVKKIIIKYIIISIKFLKISESKIVTVKKTYKYTEYVENVSSKKTVDISLIIPAYNEEKRLPPMLKETIPVKNFYFIF